MIKLKSKKIISHLNQKSILGFLFVLLTKENGVAVCAQLISENETSFSCKM